MCWVYRDTSPCFCGIVLTCTASGPLTACQLTKKQKLDLRETSISIKLKTLQDEKAENIARWKGIFANSSVVPRPSNVMGQNRIDRNCVYICLFIHNVFFYWDMNTFSVIIEKDASGILIVSMSDIFPYSILP